MPHLIGYVDDSNGQLAHYNLLEIIKDFTTANGWQALRYKTDIANRELILKGTGYSGQDAIYLIFHTYQNANSDYFNLAVGTALGYVPGNSINTQPNVIFSGIPAHNRRIDYWLTLNPQRITGVLKVGTPVYECFYAGKFLPYARPNQYPLPLICAGMLNGTPSTRFSDMAHSIPFKGSRPNMRMWFNDGAWKQPENHPWNNSYITGDPSHLRDNNNVRSLNKIILNDTNGVYGELDGVAHITGFNNSVETVVTAGNDTWIVFQDVSRTGANDYFALLMET